MRSERALALALTLTVLGGAAHAQPVLDHEMKAAFVFNFAVFAAWPVGHLGAGSALSVCANPASPLFSALGQLKDKEVNGHRLAVRAATGSLQGCHLLVTGRADRERWLQWKRDLAGMPVLTVADDAVIGSDGAMITLILADQRIAFDIDMGAVRGARLNLSSKLLRLARRVQ